MNIWDLVVIVLLLETVHGVVEQSFRERRRQYCSKFVDKDVIANVAFV